MATASSRARRNSTRLFLHALEERVTPVAGIRSIDGTGNNLAHPTWGSAGSAFVRLAPADYGSNNSPAGSDRAGARAISNGIVDQGDEDVINDRYLAAMIYAWGQFLDHDLDLTNLAAPTESFPIPVPANDPYFDPGNTGTQTIQLSRSQYTTINGVRQQINAITAWIDGSQIYGSDAATAASLRTMVGGKLKTSVGNLLPVDSTGMFLAGDSRVNENPELTALQTLFMREHNRIAAQIAALPGQLTDEQIYQQARARVIAELEAITYNEWLPALLGPNALRSYQGYKPFVNAGIANEFATAGFRLGHSMLGDDIEFLGNNGLPIADEVELADAFFNPDLVRENGIDSILKYLASDPSSEIDNTIVNGVRNFLFGPPGAGGFDLASLNIQRGRDHGLADYNSVRQAYGLPKVTAFSQISSDPDVQQSLQDLYGTVDNIDLWIGALSEDHVPGSSTGPLTRRILVDQFERLRDGDRFWYESTFGGQQLQALRNTRLTDVIRRNTELTNLQGNAFYFKASISGRVFDDRNHDGRPQFSEQGLAGRTVQLINLEDDSVVAETVTNNQGRYEFDVYDGVRTGRYRVREQLPPGWVITTPPRPALNITRGDIRLDRVDIGNFHLPPPPPGAPRPGTTFFDNTVATDENEIPDLVTTDRLG